jgi:hypothetical protein
MSVPKKSKSYHFHEREIEYFFVIVKDSCLICNVSVFLPKKGNLALHGNKSVNRKIKFKELKPKVAAQQSTAKPRSHSNNATISSFMVSNLTAKNANISLKGNL